MEISEKRKYYITGFIYGMFCVAVFLFFLRVFFIKLYPLVPEVWHFIVFGITAGFYSFFFTKLWYKKKEKNQKLNITSKALIGIWVGVLAFITPILSFFVLGIISIKLGASEKLYVGMGFVVTEIGSVLPYLAGGIIGTSIIAGICSDLILSNNKKQNLIIVLMVMCMFTLNYLKVRYPYIEGMQFEIMGVEKTREGLIEILENKDVLKSRRRQALADLSGIPSKKVVRAIERVVYNLEDDRKLRKDAFYTILKVVNKESLEVFLLNCVDSNLKEIAYAAVRQIVFYVKSEKPETYIKLLKHDDDRIYRLGIKGIKKNIILIRKYRNHDGIHTRIINKETIPLFFKNPDMVSLSIFRTYFGRLNTWGKTPDKEILKHLKLVSEDKSLDVDIRKEAIAILDIVNKLNMLNVPEIMDIYRNTDQYKTKRFMATKLAKMKSKESIEELSDLFKSDELADKVFAAEGLSYTGSRKGLKIAMKGLRSYNWHINDSACKTILNSANKFDIPDLKELFGKGNFCIMKAIAKIARKQEIPFIANALNSNDKLVRERAILVLGEIGDASAIPYLQKSKNDNINKQSIERAIKKINKFEKGVIKLNLHSCAINHCYFCGSVEDLFSTLGDINIVRKLRFLNGQPVEMHEAHFGKHILYKFRDSVFINDKIFRDENGIGVGSKLSDFVNNYAYPEMVSEDVECFLFPKESSWGNSFFVTIDRPFNKSEDFHFGKYMDANVTGIVICKRENLCKVHLKHHILVFPDNH